MDQTRTLQRISIVPPTASGEKLLFRVFDNASPIGYARLSKAPEHTGKQADSGLPGQEDEALELKMIEVSQNYRNAGVGTSLLQEVIAYCRTHQVKRLYGNINGDMRTLGRFYRENGFVVDPLGHIELEPVLSL